MYKFNTKEATGSGLRIWIAFILGFWLVGIRAELCVLLGAIGGLAVRQILSFWKAEKVDAQPLPSPTADQTPLGTPLEDVFRKPAERFRNIKLWEKLPKLPVRKPRKPPRQL